MENLRILLVENDPVRADVLVAGLRNHHEAMAVAATSEAEEALSIQNFDVVLFGSPPSDGELTAFAATLEQAEARKSAAPRPSILVCGAKNSNLAAVDGWIPDPFTPEDLILALSGAGERRNQGDKSESAAPAVADFEPEQFEEQCASESSLMIEIIDLFFEECSEELPAMGEALGRNDFEQLSRIAHTLKGSLGSLHAPNARERAQDLELAAKRSDGPLCSSTLEALEDDLESLKPKLAAFRDACSQR